MEKKHTLKGHADSVTSLCFSPDSFLLASGSDDNTVRMWDVQSGNLRTIFTGHNAKVHALNFIGSGTILFSVSKDRQVHANSWDAGLFAHREGGMVAQAPLASTLTPLIQRITAAERSSSGTCSAGFSG